ncbi:hypothetical protein GOP47_0022246 [Adiantum capillus-veneris]|uniref:Uncharacterized protein n=1 Tax=Adiantum capillus-veneris TaxID=13818 RepID=A0A9D4Z6X6_ADICA|nr:hypothetical protein GOP47_0022246 [Adiantum capillus-veneris]
MGKPKKDMEEGMKEEIISEAGGESLELVRRKRGRPRKVVLDVVQKEEVVEIAEEAVKKTKSTESKNTKQATQDLKCPSFAFVPTTASASSTAKTSSSQHEGSIAKASPSALPIDSCNNI